MDMSLGLDRLKFLKRLGAGTATVAGIGTVGWPTLHSAVEAAAIDLLATGERRAASYRARVRAAQLAKQRARVSHPTNGDEELYANKIACYSKGLPHNALGEVNLAAYGALLLTALESGDPADFEAVPMGLGRPLTNPQAGLAFDLEGPDSHHLEMRAAPTIAGAEGGGEMVELYWMALARDVHFLDYDSDATIAGACAELSGLSDFRGPTSGGAVTPGTIFRGSTAGDLIGPYLSQFLWLDIPMGALLIPQTMNTVPAGVDYLTSFSDWLAVQNGLPPPAYALDPMPRYIRNQRDLGEWVHVDALYQAYHQACLILLGLGAPVADGNPYKTSANQIGFGTFGGPHILSLVTEVATRALKAVWYQKWFVHRRLRAEAFGGLVHNTITGAATYPVNSELLNASAVGSVYDQYGSYLLPIAAPEGCPTHPSYGAGHATVAGACVTILKAWFDNAFVLLDPVVPNADGTALEAFSGAALTVGNELNKLAANVGIGRNALGFHYRSDYWDSLLLGEQLAIGILEEFKDCHNEGGSFAFTKFDGTAVAI